jgi:hypothetical protein
VRLLRTSKKHQHTLPWLHVPTDVVYIHICLQWFMWALVLLKSRSLNTDQMATLLSDALAHPGHTVHSIPDSTYDGLGALNILVRGRGSFI